MPRSELQLKVGAEWRLIGSEILMEIGARVLAYQIRFNAMPKAIIISDDKEKALRASGAASGRTMKNGAPLFYADIPIFSAEKVVTL